MKKNILITLATVMMLSTTLLLARIAMAFPSTAIQISPSSTTVRKGKTFSIDATTTDVTGLTCWEFKLYYNNILKCVDATEGPFLKTGGSTYWVTPEIEGTYNATHGRLTVGCTLLGTIPGVGGAGVLITVTFRAEAIGDAVLHFADTKLGGANIPPNPIPHTTTDGTIHIESPVAVHDVAIIDISFFKTVVCQGYSASFDVIMQNLGTYTETFAVTLYANTTQINTQTATVSTGDSQVITSIWNAAGIPLGNYTIRAEAIIEEDVDPTDNTLTDGTILVSIEGDINGDFTVDIFDVVTVAVAFGSEPGDHNWNPSADLNNDSITDIFDVVTIATNFGKTR